MHHKLHFISGVDLGFGDGGVGSENFCDHAHFCWPHPLIILQNKINADSCTLKSGCALTRSVAATLAS